MKKIGRKNGWLLLVSLAFVTLSCTKENNETPPAQELSFDAQEVIDKLPQAMRNSDDQYAQQCVSDIESALDMSTFMDDMVPPEYAERYSKKAVSGDTWSWTVSDGSMTYTFYWSYEEDNMKRYWTMDIQFNDGDRYSYISAWESKDGSSGEISYNFNWAEAYAGTNNYDDLYWKYAWTRDSDGNYEFGWKTESGAEDYEYSLNYSVVVNDDGSGSIDYYTLDTHFYHMEWDAQGNGSWTYYYGADYTQSGTWSV